jgi:5-methylcytosine-specific restriction protein A
MPRKVEVWTGKTDDTPAPPRVRLRIFEAYGGVCQLTGRKIMPGDAWDLDHRIALINGGANDEDNLWPVLREAHREKTAADVGRKAKADRVRKKHLGLWKPKTVMPGSKASKWMKPLNGPAVRRDKGDQ